MNELEKQEVIEKYFKDNAKLAWTTVTKAVKYLKLDWFFQKEEYIGAYDCIVEGFFRSSEGSKSFLDTYDDEKGKGIDAWIFEQLCNKLKSYVRDCHRDKRKVNYVSESLNAPIEQDGSEIELGDTQASDYNLEEDVIENSLEFSASPECKAYLKSLNKRQRQIAKMYMEDYKELEIRKELGISKETYDRLLKDMRSAEKKRIFLKEDEQKGEKEMMREKFSGKNETSMSEALSIEMIGKQIEQGGVDFDHPLQRQSAQWNKQQKSDLITTILHGYKIPSIINAEQYIDGNPYVWCIDGKQRITTCYEFMHDEFKVAKTAERPVIKWFEYVKDENGGWAKNENGNRETQVFEFDVRNKKFSDFPDKLQDMFKSYLMPIEKYLDCSEDDIEFHIRRYNAAKVMSASQKGITHLGRNLAYSVKNIVAESEFIEEYGCYKESERKNGTLDRMIVESVMAINFLDNWKKKQEEMCEFLKENATVAQCEYIEEIMDRLNLFADEYKDIADMWNSKDTFIWLASFDRFTALCKEDRRFFDFMRWFNTDGRHKKIEGISFDDLSEKATKDKSTVIGKLDLIEKLMKLCLTGPDLDPEPTKDDDETTEEIEISSEEIDKLFDDESANEEDVSALFEEPAPTFKINDQDTDIKKYVEDCKKSPLYMRTGCSETEIERAAFRALMIIDNKIEALEDDSDEVIQNYLNECILFGHEFEEILRAMRTINENYVSNKKIFNIEYLPALINIVSEFETDEDFEEWLDSYKEKFETFVGNINCKDCYDYCLYDIDERKEM